MNEPSNKEKFFDILEGISRVVFTIVASILYGIFLMIQRLIFVTVSFLWKLTKDIARNIYGRIVVAVGGLIFAYITFGAHTFIK